MKRRVHIGIDGNEANVLDRVGSNNYAYYILRELHALECDSQFTIFLKSSPIADMPKEKENWHYRIITPKKLWTQWRLPLDLYWRSKNLDVFFSPGHYAPRKSPVPTVVTILDLSFLTLPNLFLKTKRGVAQLTSWTQYSVDNASYLIAISEFTKKDIISHYQIDQSNISVAYPGIDRKFFSPQDNRVVNTVRRKYQLTYPYLLYVGTIQPRKNLIRLLHAFNSLPPKWREVEMVIAGQKGWMYDNFEATVNNSKKTNKIKILNYVDQRDLPGLYTGAAASVLIGLYEGFGIPPAESLACGTIPVVSNISSLPEVVGEAGIQVDPYSITEIRHGLTAALSLPDAKKKQRLKLASPLLYRYDWTQSAGIIYKVLYDIAIQRQA